MQSGHIRLPPRVAGRYAHANRLQSHASRLQYAWVPGAPSCGSHPPRILAAVRGGSPPPPRPTRVSSPRWSVAARPPPCYCARARAAPRTSGHGARASTRGAGWTRCAHTPSRARAAAAAAARARPSRCQQRRPPRRAPPGGAATCTCWRERPSRWRWRVARPRAAAGWTWDTQDRVAAWMHAAAAHECVVGLQGRAHGVAGAGTWGCSVWLAHLERELKRMMGWRCEERPRRSRCCRLCSICAARSSRLRR